MPVTAHSDGFTVGAAPSLTISHTSDGLPLYVFLSWYVPTGGTDAADRATVAFNGVDLTRVSQQAVVGQTIELWKLASPDSGTHDLVISLSSSLRVTAGVLNLRGWPTDASDLIFTADGAATDPPVVDADSRAGAEVLEFISFNNPDQTIGTGTGSTELWNQDDENVTTGDPVDGDQRSACVLRSGAAPHVSSSWTGDETEEYFGVASLSFTARIGHHLVSGDSHQVSGRDNVVLGKSNTVNANGSQGHGEAMTVTGNRSIGIDLTDTPQSLSEDNTWELWADKIRLHGPITLDGDVEVTGDLTVDGSGGGGSGSIALDDLSDVDASSPSDGDVLTYSSASPAGWAPAAPTGGGAGAGWVLLEEHTASAVSVLDFHTRNVAGQSGDTIQSDFDDYVVRLVDIVVNTNNVSFQMRLSADNGSTFNSTSNYFSAFSGAGNSGFTATFNGGNPGTAFTIAQNVANTSSRTICGELSLTAFGSTSFDKNVSGRIAYTNQGNALSGSLMGLLTVPGTAFNAFRFLVSSGTFTGKVRVYGVPK